MAVDLQNKSAPTKYEGFVEEQLGKVRGRIRTLDIGASLLMLLAATLGYALAVAAFDLAVGGAEGGWQTPARYAAFGVYVVAALGLLFQVGLKFYRRINPYFAARQLEETLPDAKNSVINWLDLREVKLAPAIRNAVGLRAARDLKQADPDKAVASKGNWLLGGVLAGLLLGLLVVFAMGPGRFVSLMGRAFAPFRSAVLPARTSISMLRPAEGNAIIGLHQKVEIRAQIRGAFPKTNHAEAPTLHLRYQPGDAFVTRPLEEEGDGTWGSTVLADQVQSGFTYKLSAGDAETPEYQVQVRSQPRATKFEVTYHYRPYRKLPDEMVAFPNEHNVLPRILGHRGTEIDLLVHTNRQLKDARVEFHLDGKKSELPGELAPEDLHAFRVKFPLEKSGQFRVLFTAADGEENSDQASYFVEVLEDGRPTVVLLRPGQDETLPANGTLALEGKATDDFGVKSMTLRLQVIEGADKPALAARPYRPGKSFAFENGTYPLVLDYQDVIPLDKLQTEQGKAFAPKKGTVLEYWLEAVDNSDFPSKDGNIGKSKSFKITILDPEADQKKLQEERKQAEDQQKKHEKDQDQKHAKENERRNQQNQGQAPSPEDQKKIEDLEKDLQKRFDDLQNQFKKEKGEAKGQEDNQPKADNKPGPDDKAEQPGKEKDKKPDAGQAGNKKEEGDKKDGDNAQAKGPGEQGQDKNNQAGEAKGGDPKKDQGQAKGNDGKNDNANPQAKEGGMNQGGQAKEKGGDNTKPPPTEAKNNTADKEPNNQGQAKGGEPAGDKALTKEGQGAADPKGAPPATTKNEGAGKAPANEKKNGQGGGEQAGAGGFAKDEAGNKAANPVAKQEPRIEDLAKLKDELAKRQEQTDEPLDEIARAKWKEEMKKRQEQAEEILDELSRVAKEAKDEKVRAAAKEILEKLGRDFENPNTKAKQAKGKGNGNQKEQGDAMGAAQAAEAKGRDPGEGDPGQAKASDPSDTAQTQHKAGGFGRGNPRVVEDEGTMELTKDFLKRGGVLQLQKLKDRLSPDVMKKAGLTDRDWEEFMKDAHAYERLLRAQEAAMKNPNHEAMGKTSTLVTNPGPRPIGSSPNAQVDPLLTNRALPPPEFREAQNEFTKRQPNK